MRMRVWALPLAVMLSVMQAAIADTFTVDSLLDGSSAHDLTPGDGTCANAFGECTLRAAIMEANALAGDDRIAFSVAGNVVIDPTVGALPTITDYVEIDGTTAPGFNLAGNSLADSLPVVLIVAGIGATGILDGLRFSGSAAASSKIMSMGIGNFPNNGIVISNGADGLLIQGCNISANAGDGIFVLNADSHTIGQTYDGFITNQFNGLGNLIANNDGSAIVLSASDGNALFGNYVGMLPDQSLAVGSDGDGIFIIGNDNFIGFYDANEHSGNYVAGNGGIGIFVSGSNNFLYANRVGVSDSGGFFGNAGDGISILGTGNRIGAPSDFASNFIANNAVGIQVGSLASSASQTVVENNSVGITAGGLGNVEDGIRISRGNEVEIIDNLIINNIGDGLEVHTDDNVIRGNSIGVSGNERHGNAGHGIYLSAESERNIVGGDNPGHANIVGDNGSAAAPFPNGIELLGSDHQLIGNYIGVTPSLADVGQPGSGLQLNGLGLEVHDNVIGFNSNGVEIGGANMTVEDNFIGVSRSYGDIGNSNDGVVLAPNQDGLALTFGPNNVVAFNGRFGIYSFTNPLSAVSFTILGNDIVNNANAGIAAPFSGDDGLYNVLFNTLAYNGNSGIFIFGDGTRTRLSANTMYGNTGIAVDINGDGQNTNDPGDPDLGPNRLLNSPEILSTTYSAGMPSMSIPATVEIEFRVDASAANAAYPLEIQAFRTDRPEPMQGRYFLTSVEYSVPQTAQTAIFELPIGSEIGGQIALIATDDEGHSSEMSPAMTFGVPELLLRDGFETFFAE